MNKNKLYFELNQALLDLYKVVNSGNDTISKELLNHYIYSARDSLMALIFDED